MSGGTHFQSQILLQLSRLARWCCGLAGGSRAKGTARIARSGFGRIRGRQQNGSKRFRAIGVSRFTGGRDLRLSLHPCIPAPLRGHEHDRASPRCSRRLAAVHCQIAATHRYSAMPKQRRKHDFGGSPWTGKPKRDTSRLEDASTKQRKQHAHKAPVRRAASKFRG